jgi:putative acetyltransferase
MPCGEHSRGATVARFTTHETNDYPAVMDIVPGDFSDPRIVDLLRIHTTTARAQSPPCSAHALDLDELKAPGISFWAAWKGETLMAIGALKELDRQHGEVKSMHTPEAMRGRGAGGAMLRHIIASAKSRGYARLSLETGSMAYFEPARTLYLRHGFTECEPFADYVLDPNSIYMTLALMP